MIVIDQKDFNVLKSLIQVRQLNVHGFGMALLLRRDVIPNRQHQAVIGGALSE